MSRFVFSGSQYLQIQDELTGDGTSGSTKALDVHTEAVLANNEKNLFDEGYTATWNVHDTPNPTSSKGHFHATTDRGYVQSFKVRYRNSLDQININAIGDVTLSGANDLTVGATAHHTTKVPNDSVNVLASASASATSNGLQPFNLNLDLESENTLTAYRGTPVWVRLWIESASGSALKTDLEPPQSDDDVVNGTIAGFDVFRAGENTEGKYQADTVISPVSGTEENGPDLQVAMENEPFAQDRTPSALLTERVYDFPYIRSTGLAGANLTQRTSTLLSGSESGSFEYDLRSVSSITFNSVSAEVLYSGSDDFDFQDPIKIDKYPGQQVNIRPESNTFGRQLSKHVNNVNEIYKRKRIATWGLKYRKNPEPFTPLSNDNVYDYGQFVQKFPETFGNESNNWNPMQNSGSLWIDVSNGYVVGEFDIIPVYHLPSGSANTFKSAEDVTDDVVKADWDLRFKIEQFGNGKIAETVKSISTDSGNPFTHYRATTTSEIPFLFQQWCHYDGAPTKFDWKFHQRTSREGILYKNDLSLIRTVRIPIKIDDSNRPSSFNNMYSFSLDSKFRDFVSRGPHSDLPTSFISIVLVGQTIYETGGIT